mgnify:CR=1 FL=1|jgi:O-acetyl-ADP-ribose deacetylase (regulator of RNase III)
MKVYFGSSYLELLRDDITRQQVDAIVNAANAEWRGGSGVDAAIHQAAGPEVLQEIQTRYACGCATGDAVKTGAGHLPAKYIFHAVGPVWSGGRENEASLLRSAHRRCLELAAENHCRSIAFPAISTGVYRVPVDLAAENALDEARRFLLQHPHPMAVKFVLVDWGTYAAFARVLDSFAV